MTWRTERLSISSMSSADAPELFAALERPEVSKYLGRPAMATVHELTMDVARKLAGPSQGLPEEAWLNFVVRCEDVLVGRLQATVHGEWAEVGWVIGSDFWGHGFGLESGNWLNEYISSRLGIAEVWATVDPINAASIRLLGRLGFVEQPLPATRQPESYDDGDRIFAKFDSMVTN